MAGVVNKIKRTLNDKIKGRPKPSTPRAGYKASGARYDKGGKIRK